MKKHYSIAICAPGEINNIVKEMKRRVAARIGWFHSRNADAYITFIEFLATDFELQAVRNILARFSRKAATGELTFGNIASFHNSGTVFLEPAEPSANYLKALLQGISLPKNLQKSKSYTPHMTIARKLRKEQFHAAVSMLSQKKVDLQFKCTSITLRELDEKRGQFRILNVFPFGNETSPDEGEQFTLF